MCLRIQEFTDTSLGQSSESHEERSDDAGVEKRGSADLSSLTSSALTNILECPVCLDTMIKVMSRQICFLLNIICVQVRIYQCRNGHNVCERCSSNPALVTCPQCREPYR